VRMSSIVGGCMETVWSIDARPSGSQERGQC
jgi:hypothetical protein